MSHKLRAMPPGSVKSSCKSPDTCSKEANSTTQVKHGQEAEINQESKATSSLMTALKACTQKKDLYQASRLHAEICNSGLLQKNIYLGTTLVSMYAKWGALARARKVFHELPVRSVVSWNALIAGYAQHGRGKEALGCLQLMLSEGISPNAITYACALKACGIAQDVGIGERLHAEIATQGLLEKHVLLGGALVDMYAKCGALARARKVLCELPIRDVVSWSALIAGYAQHGRGKEALGCFQHMLSEGLSPNAITYACTLKACGIVQDVDMGERLHTEIATQGLLQKHVLLGGALVDMYAKCGAFGTAQKVLHELPVQSVIPWSALIAGYAQHGCGREALGCFQQMLREGLSPNAITYACTLKACGVAQDVDMGERLHSDITTQGLLQKHVMLGNALVDMYAKCGALVKARKVLDGLPARNVVSWSALIAGYALHGCGKEALSCFKQMLSEDLSPDAITYACTLKACGVAQDIDMGERLHGDIASQGLLQKHAMLGNALVDMYAKCGALAKARKVLDGFPVRNVVCWSALITGYALHGCGKEALSCFKQMLSEDLSPDAASFACVLNACSHSGLMDEAQMLFDSMREEYGIIPEKELYGCMVDLFGRARHFDKAMGVIRKMPTFECSPVWRALLGACRKWGNVELGRFAFECAVEIDPSDAAAYVIMTDIFAAAGMQEEAQNMERMRISNGARKLPGCGCWTDASGKVHKSAVGDTGHLQSKEIDEKLQDFDLKLSLQGYSPDLHWVS